MAERSSGILPAAFTPDAAGRVNLRTLVYIRWAAVLGQLATVVVVHWGLGFPLPFYACLAVIGTSALLNVVVTLTQRLNRRLPDRIAAAYLAYDTLQLTVLLYLTGGLQNPFSLLVVAPVTVSATVLSRRATVGLGFLALVCVTGLALFHMPMPWDPRESFDLPGLYTAGLWEALVLGVLFVAAYVGSVSEEARKMSDALSATQIALVREQRVSELGALAAAAAHELGSPLATIAVTAKEMSRELSPDDPLADDVQLLLEQSERCRDILAQLSRRPEAGRELPYAEMAFPTLVEMAAQPYRESGVAVAFNARPEDDAPVPQVRRSEEILHGLGNFIQNAVQFAQTRVDVETRWDAETILVRVRDDGPGIPSGLLDRLGEPYVSTRGEGHMGLGVFIAHTLLTRTGAQVRIVNRATGGAEVTVRWPRRQIETKQEEKTSADEQSQPAR